MKTIWKLKLHSYGDQVLEVPRDAEILTAQFQGRGIQGAVVGIYLWAILDPSEKLERRTFYVVGTGHPLENEQTLEYIATVQDPPFVWHVFERL